MQKCEFNIEKQVETFFFFFFFFLLLEAWVGWKETKAEHTREKKKHFYYKTWMCYFVKISMKQNQ